MYDFGQILKQGIRNHYIGKTETHWLKTLSESQWVLFKQLLKKGQ
jgi:hypothetical protein